MYNVQPKVPFAQSFQDLEFPNKFLLGNALPVEHVAMSGDKWQYQILYVKLAHYHSNQPFPLLLLLPLQILHHLPSQLSYARNSQVVVCCLTCFYILEGTIVVWSSFPFRHSCYVVCELEFLCLVAIASQNLS